MAVADGDHYSHNRSHLAAWAKLKKVSTSDERTYVELFDAASTTLNITLTKRRGLEARLVHCVASLRR